MLGTLLRQRICILHLRHNVREFNCNLSRLLAPKHLLQLSPYDVNLVLRENEFVFNFPDEENVIRSYESNQLGSNSPCEDSRTEASLVHRNGFICGIFDGHAGAACGQVVSKRLLRYISAATLPRARLREEMQKGICNSQSFLKCHNDQVDFVSEIKPIYESSYQKYISQIVDKPMESVATELEQAFLQLDADIADEALSKNDIRTMAVALSGAVACLVHLEGINLHVASTGDCGAVLGIQCTETGRWQAKKLNTEHNADNRKEVERILAEHPKEERDTVIRNNRLLSQLAPLRAFGDFRYKWSVETIEAVVTPVMGAGCLLPPNYHTPPYLTAQPEIQEHVLSTNDKFLVLASDGLWDFLTPSEVVSLVGEHIASKKILEPMRLPTGDVKLQTISNILGERKAGRTRKPIDQNAATHLIRNALGATDYGIEHSKIAYYLSLPKDVVRLYRDDITITVLYFNTEHIAKLTGAFKDAATLNASAAA